jgi:hypothetical protein
MAITESERKAKRSAARKLLWFGGLWLAGLAVTAAVAYALRALLG